MPQKSGIGNQQSYIVATLYSGTKKFFACTYCKTRARPRGSSKLNSITVVSRYHGDNDGRIFTGLAVAKQLRRRSWNCGYSGNEDIESVTGSGLVFFSRKSDSVTKTPMYFYADQPWSRDTRK